MNIKERLEVPPEPAGVRKQILGNRTRFEEDINFEWDSLSLAVWFQNRIPSHLWNVWKNELTEAGLPWPRFLKLMKYHTTDLVLWVKEEISWEELIQKIMVSIDGPLGQSMTTKISKA